MYMYMYMYICVYIYIYIYIYMAPQVLYVAAQCLGALAAGVLSSPDLSRQGSGGQTGCPP